MHCTLVCLGQLHWSKSLHRSRFLMGEVFLIGSWKQAVCDTEWMPHWQSFTEVKTCEKKYLNPAHPAADVDKRRFSEKVNWLCFILGNSLFIRPYKIWVKMQYLYIRISRSPSWMLSSLPQKNHFAVCPWQRQKKTPYRKWTGVVYLFTFLDVWVNFVWSVLHPHETITQRHSHHCCGYLHVTLCWLTCGKTCSLLPNMWPASHLISRERVQGATFRVVIVSVGWEYFFKLILGLSLLLIIRVVKLMQMYLELLNVLISLGVILNGQFSYCVGIKCSFTIKNHRKRPYILPCLLSWSQ